MLGFLLPFYLSESISTVLGRVVRFVCVVLVTSCECCCGMLNVGVSPPIQIYFFRYCPRCPIFDPTVRPSVPGYSTCTVPGTWMGRYVPYVPVL